MTYTLTGALAEITAALPKVALWRDGEVEDGDAKKAAVQELQFRAFFGEADGWRFMIATWIEPALSTDEVVNRIIKGQPMRCDGTAMKAGLVIRLTPELAKLAGDLATKEQ